MLKDLILLTSQVAGMNASELEPHFNILNLKWFWIFEAQSAFLNSFTSYL